MPSVAKPSVSKRSPESAAGALPRGQHSLSREQVSANQRLRIVLAMIDVVGTQGYGATTIVDVAARAGVSRNSFYAHFPDKRECLLASYDTVMAAGMHRIERVYHEYEAWPDSVRAAIGALFEAATDSPAAIRLSLAEIGAAGAAGIARREHAMIQFEQMMRAGLELAPPIEFPPTTLPDTVLRAITGGLNRILYTRVRRNRQRELPGLVDDLVTWSTSYYPAPPTLPAIEPASVHTSNGRGRAGARAPRPAAGGRAPGTLFPRSSLDGSTGFVRIEGKASRSFVIHSQRERILDAVANLTTATGFTGLTAEAIATEAGVSLQAFYEHFKSKHEAFHVAYELGHTKGLGIVQHAFATETDWPKSVAAAIAALLGYLASEPSFAHLALLETLTATPSSAERAERAVSAYARMLLPGLEQIPKRKRPPAIAIEAIAGGLFELCLQYTAQGRAEDLEELGAHATYIALAPFIGTEQAARVASEHA